MTFSIIGRCPRTGEIGAAVAAGSIAGAARTASCAAGVGAVLTQHRSDPRLGTRGLALLRSGSTAAQVVDALTISDPNAGWRQIAVLDTSGATAAHAGDKVGLGVGTALAHDACAIGNRPADAGMLSAMLCVFHADPDLPLAERLLRALTEGQGADAGLLHSASLLVFGSHSFPLVDLRVDWHDRPIAELRAIWNRYAPVARDVVLHAVDPAKAAAPPL